MKWVAIALSACGLVALGAGVNAAVRGGALLALVATGLALLRRRARAGGQLPALKVLERRALSREAALALVGVDGRRLLVGFGRGGASLLADVGIPSPGARRGVVLTGEVWPGSAPRAGPPRRATRPSPRPAPAWDHRSTSPGPGGPERPA